MGAERSVRRLRVCAPERTLAARGQRLVEDALRTASLPGDGGELVLVRQLRLPAFAADASPQQVALGLEAACRRLVAVPGATAAEASLAAAAAVRFADPLQAHRALTARLLRGTPARAWCWALAVPGYRADAGLGGALRAVALSLARRPEAAVALPLWLDEVVAGGAGAQLLLALAADDVAVLQRANDPLAPPLPPAAGANAAARRVAAWQALLRWAGTRGGGDAHTRWVDEMARRCGIAPAPEPAAPPASADPAAGARPAAATGSGAARRRRTNAAAPGPRRASVAPAAATDRDAAVARPLDAPVTRLRPRPDGGPRHRGGSAHRADALPAPPAPYRPATGPAPRRRPPPAPAAAGTGAPAAERGTAPAAEVALAAPTGAGGLLFLVPLLERLGLPGWLRTHPAARDAALPAAILARLLQRLRVAADDPAWQLADGLAPASLLPALRRAADDWLLACRRHLRCAVGIGLASLVLRPARLALTPTHADLQLALDAVDLRIRRAGLDLDPGWVPWFGRVLHFHYGSWPP